jgi:glycosyltransferase involved in cell wall biosynthesis
MKVLYSCLSKSWGGMEMYTLTAVEKLYDSNIKVELLCIKDSRLHIEANSMGIIIHTVNASSYFHLISIFKIASILSKNNYSLVHTQASKDLWVLNPALFISRVNIPLFFTKHIASGIVKKDFLHKLLYRRVNKLFAISNVIKANLVETCPVNPDNIIVLPNGVSVSKFDPERVDREMIRNELNIKKGEIVLGMLARFTPGKGHEEFLQAAKELNNDYNNLKYLIVGEPSRGEDQYMKDVKKLAREFDLHNVLFTGYRIDIPNVLAAMDIFVFPSHAEAFGIALIEAMAMKKPSVCSNFYGVLDIVVDNFTSLLFENRNHQDLTEKLKLLIESKELRIRFGENARKRVIDKFKLENIIQKTINLYNNELKKQV